MLASEPVGERSLVTELPCCTKGSYEINIDFHE